MCVSVLKLQFSWLKASLNGGLLSPFVAQTDLSALIRAHNFLSRGERQFESASALEERSV